MTKAQHHHIESPKERQNRHKAMEAIKVLNSLREDFKTPLESMEYFYKLFEEVHCEQKALHTDKVKVGTMCIQIPSEIIYALDGVPIRLCNGFYTDDDLGSDLLPQKSCPLVKASVGHLASKNLSDKPDMIYSPTTCDQKTKAGSTIESFGYDVVDVDFPRTKESEIAREFFRRSIRDFSADLSHKVGKKLTRKNLKGAIGKIGYAQSLYHKLSDM
ncbi:MAG: 2-hydroxyacyl-CoA dehydratase family protein, partial [Sulfurimonas sp.]